MMCIAFGVSVLLAASACSAGSECSLCPDESPTPSPDKIVSMPGLGERRSCSSIQKIVPVMFSRESDGCALVHNLSTLCECPRPLGSCSLCLDGSPAPNADTELPMMDLFRSAGVTNPTCEMVESYLHSIQEDDDVCGDTRHDASIACGCSMDTALNLNASVSTGQAIFENVTETTPTDASDTSQRFFGSKNKYDEKLKYLLTLAAALLSIFGATCVVLDNLVWSNRFKERVMYNQIVTFMAMFDILYSISAAFLTLPRPTDDGIDSWGESGNDTTCKIQGWAIQFAGMTSLFLNASLSTFYVLAIVHRTRGRSFLSRWRLPLLGLPIILGLAISIASIPFISTGLIGCHVTPPNENYSLRGSSAWVPYLSLYKIPGYLVLAYSTAALLRVYWYVRRVERRASQWRMSTIQRRGSSAGTMGTSNLRNIQREVFWQSALYLFALYFCWFVSLFVIVNLDKFLTGYYWLWCFVFSALNLQGFLNSCVYFRPRWMRRWDAVRHHFWRMRATAQRDALVVVVSSNPRSVEPAAELIVWNDNAVCQVCDADEDGRCYKEDWDEESIIVLHHTADPGDSQPRSPSSRLVRSLLENYQEPQDASSFESVKTDAAQRS